jgi:spore coat protein CotH
MVLIGSGKFQQSPAAVIDSAEELFAPDNFLEVKIQINPLLWDRLRYQYRDITKERKPGEAFKSNYAYLPARVFINDEDLGEVGLRKKGLIGSSSTQRPSLKIKFNHSKKGRKYHGLERLTLNNNIQDPSLVKQYLSYKLFRKAGLPAPRCNFARVYVNGQYLGVYTNVESIRKQFLKRAFNDSDGDLYEGMINDFREGMYETFEIKDGAGKKMKSIVRAVKALSKEGDDQLNELGQAIDIDQFINFWVLEIITGHWDGYNGNLNNFFVYSSSEDKRLRFIPWGTDGTWSMFNPFIGAKTARMTNASSLLARTIYLHPETRKTYRTSLAYHLEKTWNEEEILSDIKEIHTMVENHVIGSTKGLKEAARNIREYIRANRNTLESELAGPEPQWTIPLKRTEPVQIAGDLKANFILPVTEMLQEGEKPNNDISINILKANGTRFDLANPVGQAGFPPNARWFDKPQMTLGGRFRDTPNHLRLFMSFDPERFRHVNPIKLDHFNGMAWVGVFNEETKQMTICGMLVGEILIVKKDINDQPYLKGSINAKLRLWRVPSPLRATFSTSSEPRRVNN